MKPPFEFTRRTALLGIAGAGICALEGPPSWGSARQVLLPEEFRRASDSEDAAPMIQAAIEHAAASGGGTVRLTPGKIYPLQAITPGTDLSSRSFRASLAFPPRSANVTIDLNGAILQQVSDAFTFGTKYRLFNDPIMVRTRVPLHEVPSQGDTSIRVDTPALHSGSRIVIVSGNTSRGAYTPVAEMFVVTGVDGSVIDIDRPISKNHGLSRENDVGLIDISNNYSTNISILGPGLIRNPFRRVGSLAQVFGLLMRQVAVEAVGGFGIRGHNIKVEDCSAAISRRASEFRPHAIGFDTGSSDIAVQRFTGTGHPFCYLHLHEGLSNVQLSDISLRNEWNPDPAWLNVAAISILGLSWDVDLRRVLIVNNPQGAGIAASDSKMMNGGNVGLRLSDISLQGRFRGPALIINGRSPAEIDGLDLRNLQLSTGQKAIRLTGARHRIANLQQP